ncbi:MAG: thioredoxin-like domain-containing protein [Victivallales bacterium]
MNSQIKPVVAGLIGITLFFSAHAGKNDGNARVLKKAEKELVDPAGKKAKVNLDGKEYVFIYYSAHWCPPCRAFTPDLVKFYNEYKDKASFELIFVSKDNSEKEMKEYMSSMSMPWTAVDFKEIEKCGISKFAGNGIPCLVLLDKDRNVIADSFDGEKYLGPQQVLEKFKAIVDKPRDETPKK